AIDVVRDVDVQRNADVRPQVTVGSARNGRARQDCGGAGEDDVADEFGDALGADDGGNRRRLTSYEFLLRLGRSAAKHRQERDGEQEGPLLQGCHSYLL